MIEVVSKSKEETQKIARLFAKEVATLHGPAVIGLIGNLGAGKTTFTQGFAKALGVKDRVLSPTFVLMKVYKIRKGAKKHLVHVDCYRMDSVRDTEHLNLKHFFKDNDAILLIEWAERIRKILPPKTIWIEFRHGKKPNERTIRFK